MQRISIVRVALRPAVPSCIPICAFDADSTLGSIVATRCGRIAHCPRVRGLSKWAQGEIGDGNPSKAISRLLRVHAPES